MGSNTSSPAPLSSSGTGGRGGFLGSFLSGGRLDFTLSNMRALHAQLTRFASLPDAEIVELLRVLSEFLIYSDQHRVSVELEDQVALDEAPDDAGTFFDYFGETNMLALLVELGASQPSVPVQVQLLQTMSILVQNITTRTSLYYILSNNYVNRLLECAFTVDGDDDVRDWYVTLLKALSLRLNEETVQFFLDTQPEGEEFRFPLYARALQFGRCNETMVKVAVKTLTLNVLRVSDARVRRFVLQYDDLNYFRDIVEVANDLTLKLQGLLNTWPSAEDVAERTATTEKLEEAVEAYIDHCFYIQDLLDVNVPELCYKIGDLLFSRHIKWLLASSVLPDCGPPPQRVSTQLALYLLTRLLGILEHTPLVNAVVFMLLSSDATETCEYSTVALGAGSRRRLSSLHYLETVDSNEDDEGSTATTENSSRPLSPQPSLRWDKEAPPMHVFRPHSATTCESSLCYVQTRFAMGEWPVEEVKAFVTHKTNCYRQSLLSLLCSSDERLSSTVVILLLAIVNNKAVDHSLLRELDLVPFRFRTGKPTLCSSRHDESGDSTMLGNSALPATESLSSSCDSSSSQGKDEDTTEMSVATDEMPSKTGRMNGSCRIGAYPYWLVELVLEVLARNQSSRLLSVQLCVRLLMDILVDTRVQSHRCLTRPQSAALKKIHSSSAHLVMESMRGAMAEVDLFIYVLEKEVAQFQRKPFPMELQLDSSSPFECLIPLERAESLHAPAWAGSRDTLALRRPSNEIEVCRKAMRVFLSLRKLRELLDYSFVSDGLEQLVANRHPRTSVLASAAGGKGTCTAPLDGMVSLRCTFREQRFSLMPTRLLMVMNPEAFVLVERIPDQSDDGSPKNHGEGEGIVKVFAPIHRTYCTMDPRDDRVLQVSVRSATPVPGCRSGRKDSQEAHTPGRLKDWSVLLMFSTAEDCAQAQAHINVSGTEVRAFKLHQIEESLTAHLQVTQSSNGKRRRSLFTNAQVHVDKDKADAENSEEEGDGSEDDDEGMKKEDEKAGGGQSSD
ncbi:FPL domain-containing protein [Phytophthora infestans]|uniref:FPL domain-containing protein n=1 Tax=Phytophthora infestans TaxID=4787 RepID=A0A8S9TS51_PHYIN|nr:FPL domain-containing protein [Phytophthora infestans]